METGKKLDVQIEPFETHEHIDRIISLWYTLLPEYKVPEHKLRKLLDDDRASHYVAYVRETGSAQPDTVVADSAGKLAVGFAATYSDMTTFTETERKGYISVLLVDPEYQNRGVGTELLMKATTMLFQVYVCNTICIGSVFPRFWPGVPTDISPGSQVFFRRFFPEQLGLKLVEDALCRDLCLDLEGYVSPAAVSARAVEAGITFSPLTEDGFDECMRRQQENFQNDGWVAAFEELGEQDLHDQIMVARNRDGAQIGWAIMVEPGLPVWDELAFPSLLGDKTGVVACVGVDRHARKIGIGLALVDQAIQDLKRREMEHVFVDWVVLQGWYEKLGFQTWREYRTLVWKPEGQGQLMTPR